MYFCAIMFEKKFTFDSVVRMFLIAAGIVAAVLLVKYLSGVLLPFIIAWVVAYMLYPLVKFLQYKCRLRSRILSIVVAIVLVLAVIAAVLVAVIPPTVNELMKIGTLVSSLATKYWGDAPIAEQITTLVNKYFEKNNLLELIQHNEVQEAAQMLFSHLWNFICRTVGFLVGLFSLFIVFLYIFFILLDYENIADGFVRLVPRQYRSFSTHLLGDVEAGMNAYFRGQALIAFCVGILFAIGFSIVGLPMGVGLGLFIGLLNLVPYLQLIGVLPTILCALAKSMETGQNFWLILLWCLIVFVVVQSIQDLILTPRIMGKAMGLKPAVILLSLSLWGAIMGILGLIIALPLTTLCLSYYKRYVLKDQDDADSSSAAGDP